MIELRWLRVPVGTKDAICLSGECRILQFREGSRGYADHWYGNDWQNVPVDYSTAAGEKE
jgi:hypothetical protein